MTGDAMTPAAPPPAPSPATPEARAPRTGAFYAVLATALALAWAAARIAGWREHVTALSGTGAGDVDDAARGIAFIALHVTLVGVAPILVIAAGLRPIVFAIAARRARTR